MACRGKAPCACKECGPFLLDGRGDVRRLPKVSLGAMLGRDARAGAQMPGARPLGARLESPWRGGATWPLAFQTDGQTGACSRGCGSLGAGSRAPTPGAHSFLPPGSIEPGPSPATTTPPRIPIGARPSVPPRPPPNLARIDDPIMHPMSPPEPPYGMQPQGLSEEQIYGPAVVFPKEPPPYATKLPLEPAYPGTGMPFIDRDAAQMQYVPPLPAHQETCIVNRFRPEWGSPPGYYGDVPLDFDPALGAYTFDPARSDYVDRLNEFREQIRAQQYQGGAVDPALRSFQYWHSHLASQYRSGYMLQPYKNTGDERWRTRWIPQRRAVSCHTD